MIECDAYQPALELLTMFMTITDVYPQDNTSRSFSKEERTEIEFWASARMTIAEIASRIRRQPHEVKDYADSVCLNIE